MKKILVFVLCLLLGGCQQPVKITPQMKLQEQAKKERRTVGHSGFYVLERTKND